MFVENLIIRKPDYSDTDDERKLPFIGIVSLKSPMGETKIKLTNAGISAIFRVIRAETIERADANAKAVKNGMEEAIHAPLLLQSAEVPDAPF